MLLYSTSPTHSCTDAKVTHEAFAVKATNAVAQMSTPVLHHQTYVTHVSALDLLLVHDAVVLRRAAAGIRLLLV